MAVVRLNSDPQDPEKQHERRIRGLAHVAVSEAYASRDVATPREFIEQLTAKFIEIVKERRDA